MSCNECSGLRTIKIKHNLGIVDRHDDLFQIKIFVQDYIGKISENLKANKHNCLWESDIIKGGDIPSNSSGEFKIETDAHIEMKYNTNHYSFQVYKNNIAITDKLPILGNLINTISHPISSKREKKRKYRKCRWSEKEKKDKLAKWYTKEASKTELEKQLEIAEEKYLKACKSVEKGKREMMDAYFDQIELNINL